MARSLGVLTADLILRLGGFKQGMDQAARESDRAMKRIRASTNQVVTGFKSLHTLAGTLLGGFSFAAIISATAEAAQSFALLENAVRTSGGASGKTAVELAEVATGLQNVTTFSDEAIQNLQSLLLRFQSIRGDEFQRATEAAIDLAAAMGRDLPATALALGRALEDPTRGLTALSRAGVIFSAEQKEVIKNLVETGQKAEAQRIILKSLEDRFRGAAEAARNNFGGALTGLRNAFNDLLEAKSGLPAATGHILAFTKALTDAKTKQGIDSFVSSILTIATTFIAIVGPIVKATATIIRAASDVGAAIDKALFGRTFDAATETRLLETQIQQLRVARDSLLNSVGGNKSLLGPGAEQELLRIEELLKRLGKASGPIGRPRIGENAAGIKIISEQDAEDAIKLFEETRTAAERFKAEMADLDALLQKGAITPEVYERKVKQLKEELNKPVRGSGISETARDQAQAVEALRDSYQNILTSGLSVIQALETPSEQIVRNFEEQRFALEQLAAAYPAFAGAAQDALGRAAEAARESLDRISEPAEATRQIEDLIKSIEDETSAFIANQIAMDEGAVAALKYRIAHGDLKPVFDKTGEAAAALQKRLEEVTRAQEALAERTAAIEASEQVLPSRNEAAKEYVLVLEGLGIRLREGEISQRKYNAAVKQAEENFQEASKVASEWTVFMDEAARAAQSAFADFLFDPFQDGLEGMVSGFADALRRIAAEIVAAQLAEKLFKGLEGSGKFDFKELFGFGDVEEVLAPLVITAQRLPEAAAAPAALVTGVAETTAAAAALTAAGTTVGTGGLSVTTGATALGTAAATLLTAAQAISAAAAQLAAAGAGSLAGGGGGLVSASGGNIDWLFESIFGFARGGQVPGSGSGDTVPAWLTPGEFVVRAQAAKNPHVLRLLEKINEGAGVLHYASGGQVPEPYQAVRAAVVPYKAMAAQAAPMRAISKRSLLDEEDETIRRSLTERYAQTAETFAHTRNVLASLGEQTDSLKSARDRTDQSSVTSIQDVLTSLDDRRERRVSDKSTEQSTKSKVDTDSAEHRSQTIFDLSRWTSELSENVAIARDVLNEQVQSTVQASSNIRSNIDTERNATHVDQAHTTSLAEKIRTVLSSLSERREIAQDSYETTRNRLATFDNAERYVTQDVTTGITRDVTDVSRDVTDHKSRSVTELLAQANEIRERVATSRAVLDEQIAERRAKVSDSFESTRNRLTTFDDQRTDERTYNRTYAENRKSSTVDDIRSSLSRLMDRTYENLDLFRDTDQTERRSRSIFDLANITKDVQERIATSRNLFDQQVDSKVRSRSESDALSTVRQASVLDDLSTSRRTSAAYTSETDNNSAVVKRRLLDESESIRSAKDSLREQVESVANTRQAISDQILSSTKRSDVSADSHITESLYKDQVRDLRSSQREISESLRLDSLKTLHDVANVTSQTFRDTTDRHTHADVSRSTSENVRSLAENARESYRTLVDAVDHRSSDTFRSVLTSHVGQMASSQSVQDIVSLVRQSDVSDVRDIASQLTKSTRVEVLTEVIRSLAQTAQTRTETDLVEKVQALREVFSHALSRGSVPQFAGGGPTDVRPGGMLQGPGTPTSDSMLLWGSTKEFMVRAKAAQQPGAPAFLNAFNTGKIRMETVWAGMEALKVIPKLAMGGFVSPAIPEMAWGGMVTPSLPNMKDAGFGNKNYFQTTIQAPQGQVSQQTLLNTTAAVARGVKLADRRNN